MQKGNRFLEIKFDLQVLVATWLEQSSTEHCKTECYAALLRGTAGADLGFFLR